MITVQLVIKMELIEAYIKRCQSNKVKDWIDKIDSDLERISTIEYGTPRQKMFEDYREELNRLYLEEYDSMINSLNT